MTKEKYLNMIIGVLEVEKLLYNEEETGFISCHPYPNHPYVHLREREFRMYFGQDYYVDAEDPYCLISHYNGVEFICISDLPETMKR